MESRNNIDHINALPKDLFEIELAKQIQDRYAFLHPSRFINMAKISKRFYSFFSDEHTLALDYLHRLLKYGDLSELDNAKNIWSVFPDLLTCRGTIYHPNRSYIDAEGKPLSQPIDIPFYLNPGRDGYDGLTFWQILWENEEYEEAEEAGKLMTEEEKQKQLAEIFPDGKIIKYNFDLEKAKELLRAVFKEVIKDKEIVENDLNEMSQSTRDALYALYDYAKPNAKHKTGLVFDANFYLEACKFYEDDDTSKQFENWKQRTFWCIRVEEWLKGRLGTGYLRSLSQGIDNVPSRKGCILANGSSYLAFRRPSNSIPGFHFLVGSHGHEQTKSRCVVWGDRGFSKLMASKNKIRDRLYAEICAPKKIVLSNTSK